MHHIRIPAEDFITAWVKDPMSKAGKHSPKHQLICDEDGVLYSYGRHFPLAKQVGGFTYVNMNSSSNTTNGHRAHVMAAAHGRVIECADTLDTAGILRYKEQKLEENLLKACKTRDKGFLFNVVHNPASLLLGTAEDVTDNFIKSMYKQAEEGSLLKYFTAMLLKNPCAWPSGRYETKINYLLDAVFQTGAPGKFSGLKFIQDYHRIGAAAIAAQISSIDGGEALHTVNE